MIELNRLGQVSSESKSSKTNTSTSMRSYKPMIGKGLPTVSDWFVTLPLRECLGRVR